MIRAACLALALCLSSGTARAETRDLNLDEFVAANLIAIFYHEFAHALVDVLRLPIFGQEEDAADVLSILMVHENFTEESARDIAWSAALGMRGATDPDRINARDVAWWDTHGPDLQRFYTMVCLFYGADPGGRRSFARGLGLPDQRATYCVEEYQLASESWGPVLDDLYDAGGGETMRFKVRGRLGLDARLTAEIVRREVQALNAVLSLPEEIDVVVENCGEPNAFYDPNYREIIMCVEFADYLASVAP